MRSLVTVFCMWNSSGLASKSNPRGSTSWLLFGVGVLKWDSRSLIPPRDGPTITLAAQMMAMAHIMRPVEDEMRFGSASWSLPRIFLFSWISSGRRKSLQRSQEKCAPILRNHSPGSSQVAVCGCEIPYLHSVLAGSAVLRCLLDREQRIQYKTELWCVSAWTNTPNQTDQNVLWPSKILRLSQLSRFLGRSHFKCVWKGEWCDILHTFCFKYGV